MLKSVNFFWDCDEVLIDTMKYFRKFIWEEFNFTIPEEIYDFEKIEDQLNIPRSMVMDWWTLFNRSDYLLKKEAKPNQELLGLIKTLSGSYDSHIVTSRPEDECGVSTHAWVRRHFKNSIKSIEFCNSYSENQKLEKRTKSEAIQLIAQGGFFIFIEDTHTHAINVAETNENSLVLLLEKPWNKNKEIPMLDNLSKIKNTSEITEVIKKFVRVYRA